MRVTHVVIIILRNRHRQRHMSELFEIIKFTIIEYGPFLGIIILYFVGRTLSEITKTKTEPLATAALADNLTTISSSTHVITQRFVQHLEKRVADLQGKVDKLEALADELPTMRADIVALKNQLKYKDEQLNDLQTRLANCNEALKVARNDQRKYEALQKEAKKMQLQINRLEKELKQYG